METCTLTQTPKALWFVERPGWASIGGQDLAGKIFLVLFLASSPTVQLQERLKTVKVGSDALCSANNEFGWGLRRPCHGSATQHVVWQTHNIFLTLGKIPSALN